MTVKIPSGLKKGDVVEVSYKGKPSREYEIVRVSKDTLYVLDPARDKKLTIYLSGPDADTTVTDIEQVPSGDEDMKLSTDAFAEALKDSKFEKGKPADPTKNMSDADAKEWKKQKDEHEDEFKSAADSYPGDKFDEGSVWQVRQDKGEIVIWQVQKGSFSQKAKQPKLLGEYTSSGTAQMEAQKAQKKLKSTSKEGSFEVVSLRVADYEAELKDAKFEKGKPADPTKNMDPADKKEWNEQKDEHKDEFKSAAEGDGDWPNSIMYQVRGESWKEKSFKSQKAFDTWYDKMVEKWGDIIEVRFESKRASVEHYAVDVPKDVDRYFKEVSEGNPDYSDDQAWATAWSIYCKNKNPGSPSCQKPTSDYLKKQAGELSADDYEEGLKESKFEKGKSMTPEQVSKVVGPEFKENVENPPPAVEKLKNKLEKGASEKDACGEDSALLMDLAPVSEDEDKTASDKTAASGLYGYTKEAERVCGSATNRLQKFTQKLAKAIYEKDSETPGFLEEHQKRTGSRSARMLRACMADIGPGKPEKTAGKREGGRYGFSGKTSKLALQACSDVDHEAGVIACDLNARMGSKHDVITGFLSKHAKKAKCGWSEMIQEAYPPLPAPIIASASPSVSEILAWDGGKSASRVASTFLAADEDDEDEEVVETASKKA